MRHFDLAGAATVTGGLIAIVYAIVEASSWGWGSPKQFGVAALGVVLLGAFIAIERRSRPRWCGSSSSSCARWRPATVSS